MSKLSSRGHEQIWPDPYQDEQGRWWFYDPEMGWDCKELAEERAKHMKELITPVLKDNKPVGRIFIASTAGEMGSNNDFKKLWE